MSLKHTGDRQKGRQQFCEEGTDGNVALQAKGRKEAISGCKERKRSPAEPKKEPAWLTLGEPPSLQHSINNIWCKPPSVAQAISSPGSRCLFIPRSTSTGNLLLASGRELLQGELTRCVPGKSTFCSKPLQEEEKQGCWGTATTMS